MFILYFLMMLTEIELFKSIKILGVTLDWHLSNKKHISDQLKKGLTKGLCAEKNEAFSAS